MEENVGKLVLCEACVHSTGSTKLHLKASLTKAWENAKGMQPNSQSTWDPSFGLVDGGETIANMLKGLKNVKELSNKKMEIRTTTSKINAPSESLVKSKDLLESSLDPSLVELVDEANPKTPEYSSITKRSSSKLPYLNKKVTKAGIKSSSQGRWLARRSHLNSKFAAIASTDSKSQDDAIAEASYGEATSILKDPKDPFKNIPVQSSRFKETSIQLGTIKKSLSKEKMKAIKQNVSNGKHKQKRKAINETVVMFDDPNCNVEALTEAPVGQSSYDGEATEAIPETPEYSSITKRSSSKLPYLNKKVTKAGIKSSSQGRWLARRSHLNSKFAAIASTDSKSQDDAIAEASYGEATSILKDPKDPFKNIPVQSSRFKETSIQLGTIKKSLSKEKMKAIKQNVSNGKHKQKRKAINETVVMFDDPNCNVEALTEAPVGQSSYDGEATEAIPELLWNFMYIWLDFEHITA